MFTRLKQSFAKAAVPLVPDALLEEARAQGHELAPLDDGARDGLIALCASVEDDQLLHTRGRLELKATLLLALHQRAEVERLRAAAPSSTDTPLLRPLVVAGLPRTGTTLLHRLLSLAPGARYLPLWMCMRPLPAPDEDEWAGRHDPVGRHATATALVDDSQARDPELAAIHPMHADAPEECTHLFRPTFSTWQYFLTNPLPGYARWFLEHDQQQAYDWYRLTLTLLQRDLGGDSWVLKSPQHWGCLQELLAVFPEADVVCTWRDPTRVVGSWCSLLHHLWQQKSDRVRADDVGRSQLDVLVRSTERALLAHRGASGRVVDITFDALVRDPVGTVRHVYDRTGRALSSEHEAAMRGWLADNARDRHGRHVYDAEAFGVSPADITRGFAAYREQLATLADPLP